MAKAVAAVGVVACYRGGGGYKGGGGIRRVGDHLLQRTEGRGGLVKARVNSRVRSSIALHTDCSTAGLPEVTASSIKLVNCITLLHIFSKPCFCLRCLSQSLAKLTAVAIETLLA